MEISRREHGRWLHENPPRRTWRSAVSSEPLINYNPWNKRFAPIDPEFQPPEPHFQQSRSFQRGSHPYQRQHPRPAPTNVDPSKIPSLLTLELPPKPLLPPEDVEMLRASLRNSRRSPHPLDYDEEPYIQEEPYIREEPYIQEELYAHEEPQPLMPPTLERQPLSDDEYLREEQKTKQQIEEIIAVAQALREKLDREEELRRKSEQTIPKLMDLKPKIPSLLEIYAPPPEIIPEEICWNCRRTGHTFTTCQQKKQGKFCYRCGKPGFDITSCPFCFKCV